MNEKKHKEKLYPWIDIANTIANDPDCNCDLILYCGEIKRPQDYLLLEQCKRRKKRKNVNLYLITPGGDADAAYRIARCLQDNYEKFTITIPGYCKSAGTLITLGAHAIVMSDNGELGPLDIQLQKPDQLFERMSGQNIDDALKKLQEYTLYSFENYLLPLIQKSGGQITTKTAATISKELVSGLYGNIYNHIDPVIIGEVTRAMNIATQYGELLNSKAENLKDINVLGKLAKCYPHHGFVIDRKQCDDIFNNVRQTNDKENELIKQLGQFAVYPMDINPLCLWLSEDIEEKKADKTEEK